MTNGPSEYLTWDELACKDGTPYPLEWRESRATKLALCFEELRLDCGNRSIQIISAYRTESWNKKVHGARHSQHIQGRAFDMKPPKDLTLDEFYRKIQSLAKKNLLIGGIGKYKTFVHMDIRSRTDGKIAYWYGTGMKEDITL